MPEIFAFVLSNDLEKTPHQPSPKSPIRLKSRLEGGLMKLWDNLILQFGLTVMDHFWDSQPLTERSVLLTDKNAKQSFCNWLPIQLWRSIPHDARCTTQREMNIADRIWLIKSTVVCKNLKKHTKRDAMIKHRWYIVRSRTTDSLGVISGDNMRPFLGTKHENQHVVINLDKCFKPTQAIFTSETPTLYVAAIIFGNLLATYGT